jgi:prepilin signal peptidase PulO-like enzyme (type II secretory pathway)
VELLTGSLLFLSPYCFPFGTLIWLKGVVCGYALIVLFFTDFTEFILPDTVQFPMMVLGVLFALPQMLWPDVAVSVYSEVWGVFDANMFHNGLQFAPLCLRQHEAVAIGDSFLGLLGGYGLPWAFNFSYVMTRNALAKRFFNGEQLESGMGKGDFKMLAWIGAFWGWGAMLGILFLAVLLMCVFVLPAHFLHGRDSRTMYPLGCGLALATPIVVFWGPSLWGLCLNAL